MEAIGEKFDVVIDPVGGPTRSGLLSLLKPGGRLIAVSNASEDWAHQVKSNDLWLGNITLAGFNAGAYLPAHPKTIRPALDAALKVVSKGLGALEIHSYPFDQAAEAHKSMEDRNLVGRIVLVPSA